MNYRPYKEDDFERLRQYCSYAGIALPDKGSHLYIAVDKENNICGIIGVKQEIFIEPLISDNPLIANKLYEDIIRNIEISGFKKVRCICNPKFEKLFGKKGFRKIEENKIIMEKEVCDG
jgi:hypothetical protein